jgi:DNA topoisomerase I
VTLPIAAATTHAKRRRKRATAEVLLAEPAEPAEAAQAASLRYVSDQDTGIRRQHRGTGFVYLDAKGRTIRDTATLARIRGLVIPPAWRDVWISPHPNGHIQATGRDERGRKQYIYHPRWRQVRDEAKFLRMAAFGAALPRIRRRVSRDLKLPGGPREKILATLVRLLETTLIRVGNDEYARTNGSFGLTTLRNRHVEVHGATIRFRFRGKSGKQHEIDVTDPRLARLVRRCQELPGQALFEYLDEQGQPHSIDSADVNDYLREIAGEDFTAKDFRTWAATVMASEALRTEIAPTTSAAAQRTIAKMVQSVASRLGNTASICRKCYIHPAVIEEFLSRVSKVAAPAGSSRDRDISVGRRDHSRRRAEAALLSFLRRTARRHMDTKRETLARTRNVLLR